jgi:biotin transporter BioY
MSFSFNPDTEYLLLFVGAVLVFGFLRRWIWQGPRYGETPLLIGPLVAVVLGCGWLLVEASTNRERLQMEQIVSQQTERILGYRPAEWTAMKDFWNQKLHIDEQWVGLASPQVIA